MCTISHTPVHTNAGYTHRNPGMEYTTTVLHFYSVNMKKKPLFMKEKQDKREENIKL